MKKLMILLGSISLFAPSTTMLVSCSKTKNPKNVVVKNDVKFEKTDYNVLVKGTVSVNIANFADLEKAGYTKNCSVIVEKSAVAKFVDTQKDVTNKNYQTIQLSGISAGTTKVTVQFTNLNSIDVKEGSFNITVVDFSQYNVTWDTDKKTIDPNDKEIKVGNLSNYQEFVKMNYKDFTINMKSKDDGVTDINQLLNGCEIKDNGDIYLNVDYSRLSPAGSANGEYKLGTVTFTLSNTFANYTSKSGEISFNPFKGVEQFSIAEKNPTKPIDPTKPDPGFDLSKGNDFTVTFYNNTIKLKDIQAVTPKITFSSGSEGDFTASAKFSEPSKLADEDKTSFNLNLTFTTPSISYASGNITIDIRFISGSLVYYANQSFKYSANRVSPGDSKQFDKPSDTDKAYTSKYSLSSKFSDWQIDKPAAQSIAITTAANLDAITTAGYKYKDTLTIADNPKSTDDDNYYNWSKLNNLDLSNEENAKNFKALDSKTSFSKITAFSINNISVGTDNNLTLNINKLTDKVANDGIIHFVSRFYDKVGNVCCATAIFNYSASKNLPPNNVTFTRGSIPYVGQDGPTNQGESLSKSIHLTDDDLSFDSFGLSTDNNDALADATILSDKTDILAVDNKLEKKDDNKYYIKMKLIGQKGKDVEQGKVTLTLISGDKSFTLDIYYGTYVGKDATSGNYAISNTKTSGSVNYFISKNATNRSIDVSYSSDYGKDSAPNLEFADGYNYSGSESPFKYHAEENMVGNVTFDGDINVTGKGVIAVDFANEVQGNILFKGKVTYTANNDNTSEACGVISEKYGNYGDNAVRISENKEIHFINDIQIYASAIVGAGVGFINTIMTGIIGQVNVDGSVNIGSNEDSSDYVVPKPVGIIYSKSESYQQQQGFDNLKGLTINGDAKIFDKLYGILDVDNSATISNFDEFYSPNAIIDIKGEASCSIGGDVGPLISSVSNTSDASKVFAFKEVKVGYWFHSDENNTIIKLQTGSGSVSSNLITVGTLAANQKVIPNTNYPSLKEFTASDWNLT
ncbi:hypothetical protein [Spiroplasma endosymbiont of Aspidapion aeneum]|uniref:hypothetical protein n=1 Tax=Spiroplasma endosymbiont of Aspidapion aeneum TaxID=3066276 RepID=UPI00313A8ABC